MSKIINGKDVKITIDGIEITGHIEEEIDLNNKYNEELNITGSFKNEYVGTLKVKELYISKPFKEKIKRLGSKAKKD